MDVMHALDREGFTLPRDPSIYSLFDVFHNAVTLRPDNTVLGPNANLKFIARFKNSSIMFYKFYKIGVLREPDIVFNIFARYFGAWGWALSRTFLTTSPK